MATLTKTLTVVPSGYTNLTNLTTSSSYPITRAYKDSSSTSNYARVTLSTSTTGYMDFTFDCSDIPSTATITGVTGKARLRISNASRVTNRVCRAYTNTTAMGSNVDFSTTTSGGSVVTLNMGNSWTRSQLLNLRVRIGGTGSSSTSSKYIYIYGIDVTITYTVPAYTVSASGVGTLDPSTSQTIEGGNSYTLRISGLSAKPTVTDNGTNVTSQLTETNDETILRVPADSDVTTFTATNISNAYNGADNSTYADLTLAGGGATGEIYLNMYDIAESLPSGATIKSVTCQATLQFNPGSSTSGFSSSCQVYSGTTAKGTSLTWAPNYTAIPKTTFTLDVGTWTYSELIQDIRFHLTAINNASSTQRHVYIYGISFSVVYESNNTTYIYTINSVTGDHTIVVSAGSSGPKLYVKINGTWTEYSKVYKKVNGSWVEQASSTWATLFNTSTNYRKMN